MQQDRSLKVLLWLVAIGFFMQTLDATIVNTALPAMARSHGKARCACSRWWWPIRWPWPC